MNNLRPKNESLARFYRPKNFEDICGQDSIIKILKRQIDLHEFKNVYLFCGSSGCVDKDTEFFNGEGWKKISEYNDNDKVLIYHEDGTATLEYPQKYIVNQCDHLTHFSSKYGMDMCLSDEHRIIYYSKRNNIKETTCGDLLNNYYTKNHSKAPGYKIKTTFNYEGNGIDLSDAEIRVMVMTMADGSFRNNTNLCCVNVKKKRKIERAKQLLEDANIEYRTNVVKDFTRIYYYAPRREKVYTKYWYDCNKHQFEIICDEIMYWDGDSVKKSRFNSNCQESLDFVQFAFAARGIRSSIPYGYTKEKYKKAILADGTEKTYYYPAHVGHKGTVIVTQKRSDLIGFPRYKSGVNQFTPEDGKEYCFTVSTGMWVMRRNGCIAITGNCGKTTTARAFADLINNGNGSPIEIDAASNNGVDNVRTLVKTASERAVDSEYKIVIIDECHSLTNQAWQSFLKCIEEPPKYTIFIFCTTDPQKIPDTILNRVMRFNFNKIPVNQIKNRLEYICKVEGFTNYDETCDYISKICNGQMRDGIALLDKCASYNEDLSIDNVIYALGDYSYNTYFDLINKIIDGNTKEVLNDLTSIYNSGNDLKLFIEKFLEFCVDVEKYIIMQDCSVTKIPSTMEEKLKNSINFNGADSYYLYVLNNLLELKNNLKTDVNPFSTIQVVFMKMCRCQ